jgi:hypothetical protein
MAGAHLHPGHAPAGIRCLTGHGHRLTTLDDVADDLGIADPFDPDGRVRVTDVQVLHDDVISLNTDPRGVVDWSRSAALDHEVADGGPGSADGQDRATAVSLKDGVPDAHERDEAVDD